MELCLMQIESGLLPKESVAQCSFDVNFLCDGPAGNRTPRVMGSNPDSAPSQAHHKVV